jgi:hypothetical protein
MKKMENKKSILFLDNDGVICLHNNWGGRQKKWEKFRKLNPDITLWDSAPVDVRFDDFDKKAVKVLNQVLEETGAEIVISSDWKLHATLDELGEYFLSQGISKKPIDMTPNLGDFDPTANGLFMWKGWLEKKRILEIQQYLELNPHVEKWVAVDDLNMSPEFNGGYGLDNFVLTPRMTEGIKQSGIKEKIIGFLK